MSYLSATSPCEAIFSYSAEQSTPHNDYWNIDDIIADEQLVPVQLNQHAPGLAYLDQIEQASSLKNKKKSNLAFSILWFRLRDQMGSVERGSKVGHANLDGYGNA